MFITSLSPNPQLSELIRRQSDDCSCINYNNNSSAGRGEYLKSNTNLNNYLSHSNSLVCQSKMSFQGGPRSPNQNQNQTPNVAAFSVSTQSLDKLQSLLQDLQDEFELELDSHEEKEERVRRIKSQMLAADFANKYKQQLSSIAAAAASSARNSTVQNPDNTENPSQPHASSAPAGTPTTEELKNKNRFQDGDSNKTRGKANIRETTSPSASVTAAASAVPGDHHELNGKNMVEKWSEVTELEKELENNRDHLRKRFTQIQQIEDEIQNISLYLKKSRALEDDDDEEKDSLVHHHHHQHEIHSPFAKPSNEFNLSLPSHEDESSVFSSPNRNRQQQQQQHQQVEPVAVVAVEQSSSKPSDSDYLLGADSSGSRSNCRNLAITMSPSTSSSTTRQQEGNLEGNNSSVDVDNDALKITRVGWISCVALNFMVLTATIVILVVTAYL